MRNDNDAASKSIFAYMEDGEEAPFSTPAPASEALLAAVPAAVDVSLDSLQSRYVAGLRELIVRLTDDAHSLQARLKELAAKSDEDKAAVAALEQDLRQHEAKKAAWAAKIVALDALAVPDDRVEYAAPAKAKKAA